MAFMKNLKLNIQALKNKKTYKLFKNTFKTVQKSRKIINPLIDNITSSITGIDISKNNIKRSR
ncbi:MAG: hypothetical protein ACOXZR_04775 [Bacilli bacterium]